MKPLVSGAWSLSRLAGLPVLLTLLVVGVSEVSAQDISQLSPEDLESRVVEIFMSTCAQVGCHAGSNPQMGMALTEEQFYGHIVDAPSRERPELKLIDPGRPDSSYLIHKVKGREDIVGAPMPFTGEKLSEQEVQILEEWTRGLTEVDMVRQQQAGPKTAQAFSGWKVINMPTTRMVDARRWLFLISHRFVPAVGSGYDTFYGLDGSGTIFLNLGYAPSDELFINLGRSNVANTVELDVKYRLAQQTLSGGWPVGLALQGAVNWQTEAPGEETVFTGERLSYTGQLILTRELFERVGVSLVPGVLVNPVVRETGESAHLTVGLGARWRFYQNLSWVGEWTLIPAGFQATSIFGQENRFDSWGTGLEIAVGGHVFQIVVTNALGLTSDQYLRGGDLDIAEGELRLGFNIFRILNF